MGTVEEIYAMNTRELWNAFKRIVTETGKEYENEEFMVKQGIDLNIPIWYFTEEWYTLYPENKRAAIKGYGKYEIKKLMEEIDKREDIMRKTILENNELLESEEARID